MVAVRPGQRADLDAIRAIQYASPEAAQWDPEEYFGYQVWVGETAEAVCGFLVVRTPVAGESEILNLAVSPECRRQGIARALLHSCLDQFQGAVYLEVRASNQAARNLYKSVGFQELTVRTGYYSDPPEDGIVMKFHSC
ncbi:MAG: ribosomal-protein-alanine N-acetyltransferase [Terriglobia bacterium]|nr:MAG: ribosomal-protein-alanine N-acetyltransferase [Terriglobia bacterium]